MKKIPSIQGKPNKFKCYCGYGFVISRKVMSRLLACPDCGRNFWYERDLDNTRTVEPIGRFKSKKEQERRNYERARQEIDGAGQAIQAGPEPAEDQESPGVRAKDGSDFDPAVKPEVIDGPDKR